jgi:hypothetical protein
VPFLILAIALAAFLGSSLTNAMIAIGVSATPIFIRLTRAQVLAGDLARLVDLPAGGVVQLAGGRPARRPRSEAQPGEAPAGTARRAGMYQMVR